MSTAAHLLVPPLRDGDELTSEEFLRRWEAMPDLKHAELLDGVVSMPSPVSDEHSSFQLTLGTWLDLYAMNTPGCDAGSDGTWLMGAKQVLQPDIALWILPGHGGQSRREGSFSAGAPELALEIGASTSARDLNAKQKLYLEVGVQEYVVAATRKEQLLWLVRSPDGFVPLEPEADGVIRSPGFPGLWLDVAALWRRDKRRVVAVLQQGLATPEHAAFVERLAR
ncbi:MAG: Uma2 family endonuclease [Bryobacteraceae bacterium]|nr:Uma2 family endonuclease [Bryobacteraceae bacterium]